MNRVNRTAVSARMIVEVNPDIFDLTVGKVSYFPDLGVTLEVQEIGTFGKLVAVGEAIREADVVCALQRILREKAPERARARAVAFNGSQYWLRV